MKIRIAVLVVLFLSTSFLCCFEDDDKPFTPNDGDFPTADILSPASGDPFTVGDTIIFIGTGIDPQDGALDGASLVWEIDPHYLLGTGDTIETDTISAGLRTVKLTVTDSDGNVDYREIAITVVDSAISIDNIWPNSEGDRWTYRYTSRWWGPVPPPIPDYWPTPEEVPGIPTMEELEDLLRNQPIGDVIGTAGAEYRLVFAGDTTTSSGAVAQNLRETFTSDQGAGNLAAGTPAGNAFLARLSLARPDLAEKIKTEYPGFAVGIDDPREAVSSAGPGAALFEMIFEPNLVHGYAWEKTGEWIGTYGDVDQALAWKFLESNLRPGHWFVFQLVPSLADNVFLHCKILRTLTVNTPQGSYANSLECLYAIDYGCYIVTDEFGSELGYWRSFDYGSVIYSPGIGPVYSYERVMLFPGNPPSIGMGDLEISLTESAIH